MPLVQDPLAAFFDFSAYDVDANVHTSLMDQHMLPSKDVNIVPTQDLCAPTPTYGSHFDMEALLGLTPRPAAPDPQFGPWNYTTGIHPYSSQTAAEVPSNTAVPDGLRCSSRSSTSTSTESNSEHDEVIAFPTIHENGAKILSWYVLS